MPVSPTEKQACLNAIRTHNQVCNRMSECGFIRHQKKFLISETQSDKGFKNPMFLYRCGLVVSKLSELENANQSGVIPLKETYYREVKSKFS